MLVIAAFVLLAFVVDKGVDTLSDKLEAQEEVESRTGIRSNSFNTEHPPQDDLVDWTCTSTPNGFPLVTGTVKNNSSQTSTYTIIVEFKQNGAEFTSGTGLVVSVDPDRTAELHRDRQRRARRAVHLQDRHDRPLRQARIDGLIRLQIALRGRVDGRPGSRCSTPSPPT